MRPSRSPSDSTSTHVISPAAASASRSPARYPSMRAGRMSVSKIDAAGGAARRAPSAAGGEDPRLEDRRGERPALQALDDVEERVEAGAPRDHALPRGDETAEHGRLDGLDFVTQPRERAPAQRAKDVGIAPLAVHAARTGLAFDERGRASG